VCDHVQNLYIYLYIELRCEDCGAHLIKSNEGLVLFLRKQARIAGWPYRYLVVYRL
jgi:hypothetical protein